jgi:DNA replication protein DnaC
MAEIKKIQLNQILSLIDQRRSSYKPRRWWINLDIVEAQSPSEAFEQMFRSFCQLYDQRISGTRDFRLHISDKFRSKLDFLQQYLTGDRTHKGLLLFGGYGTGKTMTLWALAGMLKLFNQSFEYRLLTSSKIVELYRQTGEERDYITLSQLKNVPLLIIDDLGTEQNAEISVFGNRQRPIENLLEHRYRNGLWTWITTNYTLSHLAEIYSGYIIDRLRQMMYFLHFDWQSFRE